MDELQDWLEKSWDPDLTVGEWWERLGMSGWAAPLLPVDCYGRGLSRGDALVAQQTITKFGALGAPIGLGLMLAAPTIATHGTRDQIERYIPDLVTGRRAWCQLFSEPGAGSDLAGLTTRAVRDGDLWHVNGQKVWTSGGQIADLGMLIARTNPDAPKHQGITWFAIDMHQPGVEIRPLREMTGHAMFNEVFLTDAVVPDDARIGDVNNGWAVANTTLQFERSGMGAGGGAPVRGALMALPGTVAGHLQQRAGDFVAPARKGGNGNGSRAQRSTGAKTYIDLAKSLGRNDEPAIRQDLARLHTLSELAALQHRAPQGRAGGRRRHPWPRELHKALDGRRRAAEPRPGSRAARRARHAPCVRRRGSKGAGGRARRCRGDHGDEPGPRRAGTAHLRRHRSDPAQHHQRARARAPEGAGRSLVEAVLRAAEERLSSGIDDWGRHACPSHQSLG